MLMMTAHLRVIGVERVRGYRLCAKSLTSGQTFPASERQRPLTACSQRHTSVVNTRGAQVALEPTSPLSYQHRHHAMSAYITSPIKISENSEYRNQKW